MTKVVIRTETNDFITAVFYDENHPTALFARCFTVHKSGRYGEWVVRNCPELIGRSKKATRSEARLVILKLHRKGFSDYVQVMRKRVGRRV